MSRSPARMRAAVLVLTSALVLVPTIAEARTIKGTSKNDKLVGTGSADTISGLNGNDKVIAKGGNDTVSGGSGNDVISGGNGDDALKGDVGNDVVDGGDGNDKVTTSPPKKGAQTPDDDAATGGDGNDTIATGPGSDRLDGGGGNDTLNSDTGNDVLVGAAGIDRLNGGDGNDRLDGGIDDDWLQGAEGDDLVVGGDGVDHPQGGPGNDQVYGGPGSDQVDGDEGDDFLDGGDGDESCPGFAQEPHVNKCTIFDGIKPPNITADAGDDVIYPGAGVDAAFGEEGYDQFVVYDDGVYDKLWCADVASEPNTPAVGGMVTYVGMLDPLDQLQNCEFEVLTETEFEGKYPDLPLPTAVPQPSVNARVASGWWLG
ncbi:MAG: hypothetical protein WB767_18010 [Nocardioides sp.]